MHKQFTKDFNSKEFDSPDLLYSGLLMDLSLVNKLQLLRNDFKKPIYINSGYRTAKHNKKIKGALSSAHLKGLAVDIHCVNLKDRYKLLNLALSHGFKRIGVYSSWIHLDIDCAKTQRVIWLF